MERFRVTPSSSLWTFNSLAPTRLQGPCLFGRPARKYSRMCVQLMASARYSCVQSHDLEAIASLLSMVPRRVAVQLVLLWAFLRLRRTHRALRVSKERRFLRRWNGSAPFHRARSGHYKDPCLLVVQREVILVCACKASARYAIDSTVETHLYYLWACYVRTVT